MPHHKNEPAAVGVVPRRQVRTLDALMSDAPERLTVSAEVASPHHGKPPYLPHWLSAATAFGMVAAVLEWLKLTR